MTVLSERRRALEWSGEALRDMRSDRNDIELFGAPVPAKLRELADRIFRHYSSPEQILAATEMDDVPVSGWIASEPCETSQHKQSAIVDHNQKWHL